MNQAINLVIVGAGNAAKLHLLCYSKINYIKKMINIIAIVDNNASSLMKVAELIHNLNLSKPLFFTSVEEVMQKTNITNVILDICVPTEIHYDTIIDLFNHGAKKFIVEKPLTNNLATAKKLAELPVLICVVENYLFSETTRMLNAIIALRDLKIRKIISNFSKNRRKDSLRKRGFVGNSPPHIFTIEAPHQIALILDFIGMPVDYIKINTEDMVFNGQRYKAHGKGSIIMRHKFGVLSFVKTSLITDDSGRSDRRNLVFLCKNGYKLKGSYPNSNFKINSTGCVELFQKGKKLLENSFHDDSLTVTLYNCLQSLVLHRPIKTNLEFGLKVMEVIDNICY